jgi:chromate transporter
VLAIAQHELVERQRWLTRQQFVEMLSLSQVLPGPNVVNLALMLGDRFFGWRGALASLGGMLLVPLVIVLVLTAAYAELSRIEVVAGALRGMGAVAAGLVIATAFKLMGTLRSNRLGLPLAAAFSDRDLRHDRVAALAAGLACWPASARWRSPWPGCAGNERLVPHRAVAADLLGLFGHFLVLSLFAVGGAITTAPDMHRYIVDEHHWISDAQFTSSIAIAQAAPGPNVLFVATLGWSVAGPLGAIATMFGTLIPSTLLTLAVTRWGAKRKESRGVRAFTTGLTPLTIGLLVATGWLLAAPYATDRAHAIGAIALVAITVLVMARTRLSPMWLVGLGASSARSAGSDPCR